MHILAWHQQGHRTASRSICHLSETSTSGAKATTEAETSTSGAKATTEAETSTSGAKATTEANTTD